MLTAADYLKYDPWVGLITIINNKYRLSLDANTTRLVNLTSLGGTSTEVTLAAKRSQSSANLLPAFSERTYQYDRVDLSAYFGTTPLQVAVPKPTPVSSYEMVKRLAEYSGIPFTHNDVITELITSDAVLSNYRLDANPRSLRWVGHMFLNGTFDSVDLATDIVSPGLPTALALHKTPANRTEAAHYLHTADFTPYRRDLLPNSPGGWTLPVSRLVEVVRRCTQDTRWVGKTEPAPYNLCGGIVEGTPIVDVVYNGLVKAEWTPVQNMRYVMVVKVNTTLCTNMTGHWLLHYR